MESGEGLCPPQLGVWGLAPEKKSIFALKIMQFWASFGTSFLYYSIRTYQRIRESGGLSPVLKVGPIPLFPPAPTPMVAALLRDMQKAIFSTRFDSISPPQKKKKSRHFHNIHRTSRAVHCGRIDRIVSYADSIDSNASVCVHFEHSLWCDIFRCLRRWIFPPPGRGMALLFQRYRRYKISRGTASAETSNTLGWVKFAIFDWNRCLPCKRYEIGPWLLYNRKS